ncbi:MAG TPA: cation:proton antiporter [Williamwhitmania sp.]|nr:cation:proton antiporter [Williamwhitmania sp.]
MIDNYLLIILIAILVILSYFFDVLAEKIHIPAVLMLMVIGAVIKVGADSLGYEISGVNQFLQLAGIVGLIFIVLDGAIDLELTREKLPLILKSFAAALVQQIAVIFLLAAGFSLVFHVDFHSALANAVPFAVISSAIAISSVKRFAYKKREFITYESTFSDILGIMFFNYIIEIQAFTPSSATIFIGNLVILALISVAGVFFLAYIITRIKSHNKVFLILALLILMYALGEKAHLSTLLLILAFGLFANNLQLFSIGKITKYIHFEQLAEEFKVFRLIVRESTFLIRTVFFILFGYSINLASLMSIHVFLEGMVIALTVLGIRFLYYLIFSRKDMIPQVFIAPRGLITILLYYSIPAIYVIPELTEGVLAFVIAFSIVIMIGGIVRRGAPNTGMEPGKIMID